MAWITSNHCDCTPPLWTCYHCIIISESIMEHWKLSTLNNAEHWIRRALDGSNAQFWLLVIEWCYWSHWPDKPPKLQMLNPSSTLNPPHSFVVNVGWQWTYWWSTCGYECFNDFMLNTQTIGQVCLWIFRVPIEQTSLQMLIFSDGFAPRN